MWIGAIVFALFVIVATENPPGCGWIGHAVLKGMGIHRAKKMILGGDKVNGDQVPWVVRLDDEKGKPMCTGTIISNRHVLTAAHCFTEKNNMDTCVKKETYKQFRVCRLMSSTTDACPEDQTSYIADVHWVDNYFSDSCIFHGSDIVVIELQKEIENAVPVCLPERANGIPSRHTYNNEAFYLGYSSNDDFIDTTKGPPNNGLKFVNAGKPIRCRNSEKEDFLCTKQRKDRSLCGGDSGGPMIEIYNEKATIIGLNIVSDADCDVDDVTTHKSPEQTSITLQKHVEDLKELIAKPPING